VSAVILEDRKRPPLGVRGQRFFGESIRFWYAGGDKPSVEDLDATRRSLRSRSPRRNWCLSGPGEDSDLDATTSNYHIEEDAYGSVDQAIRYVQRLVDAVRTRSLFMLQMGAIPHEATMETIRNIGKHLIPHFASVRKAAEVAEPHWHDCRKSGGLCDTAPARYVVERDIAARARRSGMCSPMPPLVHCFLYRLGHL